MSKIKIIFVDVDGVFNSETYYRKRVEDGDIRPYPLSEFDPEAVKQYIRIIQKTGAKTVISSSWRHTDGLWEDAIYESFDGHGGKLVFHHYSDIMLPKGTIEKILGRKISCLESPVELEDNYNY